MYIYINKDKDDYDKFKFGYAVTFQLEQAFLFRKLILKHKTKL